MSTNFHFEVLAWNLARVSELFQFHHEELHDVEWSIKGHNRPWIIKNGEWEPGLCFLDVGAGFSDLPAYLAEKFDLEGWVADDYGSSSGESMWSRWGDPKELPKKHSHIKYVFKNLGESYSPFPQAYFDRVYSVSVLEHIPKILLRSVIEHMAHVLKPGGLMLHTIDVPFPRTVNNPGIFPLVNCFARIIIRRALILIRAPGHNPYPFTVEGWSTLFDRIFHLHGSLRRISTLQMMLDQDVLIEPPEVVYSVYPPNNEPKPYWKAASLVFKLRKQDA